MNDWNDRVVDAALQELHGCQPPDLSARVLLALREANPGPLPTVVARRSPTRQVARVAVAAAVFAAIPWFLLHRYAGPFAEPTRTVAYVEVDVSIGEVACRATGASLPTVVVAARGSGELPLATGTRLQCDPASVFSLGTFGELSTRPLTELEVKTMEFRKEHGVVAATFLTLGVVTGGVAWQALGRGETATAGEVVRLESGAAGGSAALAENVQLKQRIGELEQQLASIQGGAARSDATPAAVKIEPSAPQSAVAEKPSLGMLFSDPKYAEALAGIDWTQMGAVTNEMGPLLAELVEAMGKEGAEVPMDLAIKIQQLNSKLLAGVPAMLKAGLPGFGPNGTYTHPLVVANTLASTLAAAGQALSPAQQRTLEGLVKVFSADAQGINDSSRTFALEQLVAETEMKERFFKEVGSHLSPEQAAAMHPKGAGKYDGSSLFSAGLITQAHAKAIPARDAAEFARIAGSRLADQLGLDEATAAQVRTVLAQASASSELWQDRGDATETSLRMMRNGRTQAALRSQLVWMRQIQQQVNLTPEQRDKLAKMKDVLVPLPR